KRGVCVHVLRLDHRTFCYLFLKRPPTAQIFALALHDALPILSSSPATRSASTSCGALSRTTRPPGPRASRGSPRSASQLVEAERSEEHTSELQSRGHLVCRLLLEKKT